MTPSYQTPMRVPLPMNKQPTLNLLRQRFGNITDSATDVVRAEYRYHDAPLGVFYFDFSQAVIDDSFDLHVYLQDRIATDFYRHEGSLQWNYYLYFILEPAALLKLRNTPRAAQIEGDRSFARKFLRDAVTLEKELSHPLAATLHSTAPSQDIASRWTEALKEAGLARIADPTADYAPLIRNYLTGTASETPPSRPTSVNVVANGRFIQTLQLDRFRPHPTRKSFSFGTVNLIRGANGTGKTSLLEAIELCLCGGIRRQRGERPSGVRLQVQFQGQSESHRCPDANASLYRARDLAWYGGYYLQGNRMFDNFGRFNFFDSDAATLLSGATNGELVLKAINTLLLGEFANTLEERMKQCKERFTREQRELQKLALIWRKDLSKATEDLKQVRAVKDTREALITELKAKAQEFAWKKVPTRPKLEDLALLQEAVEDKAERLAQDARRLPWIARLSIDSLQREAAQISETTKEFKNLKDIAEKNAISLEKDRDRVTVLEMQVKILSRFKLYHIETEAMSLAGCRAAIESIRISLARCKDAAAMTRSLNLKPFEQALLPLDELAAQNAAEITKRRRDLTKLGNRATELQTLLGSIKSVVEEIKGLGQRFCEVSPNSKDCPLCGTAHDDLRHRIATLSIESGVESPLGELTAEIARGQASLDEFQKTGGVLDQVRKAAQLTATGGTSAPRSMKAMVEELSKLNERIATEEAKLDHLVAKEKRLKLAGFNEHELEGLFEEAKKEHGWSRSRLENAEGVQALLTEKIKSLEAQCFGVKDREKVDKETQAKLRRLIGLRLGANADDPAIELERRQAVVD